MATGLISINSLQVQRAKRINELETYKLDEKLRVIEKSRKCIMATLNNDIRLIQQDIAYINVSSGKSAEGRPPEEEIRERERRRRYRRRKLLRKRLGVRRSKTSLGGSLSDDEGDERSIGCRSVMSDVSEKSYLFNAHARTLRPQTAPAAGRNKHMKDRPSTVTHPRPSNLRKNDEKKEKSTEHECVNGNGTDDMREMREHHNHHVAFALTSDEVFSDGEGLKKSVFAKQAELGYDDDDEGGDIDKTKDDRRLILPPDYFTSAETTRTRKTSKQQFRDPRAMLLREESRTNLTAQVGEEDLTKALARHMSRNLQRDPTSATHASRQKSIRGFHPNGSIRRSVVEMPGTVTRTEEKDVRISIMKF